MGDAEKIMELTQTIRNGLSAGGSYHEADDAIDELVGMIAAHAFRADQAQREAARARTSLEELRKPLQELPMDGNLHLRVKLVDHTGKVAQAAKVVAEHVVRYGPAEVMARTVEATTFDVLRFWREQCR